MLWLLVASTIWGFSFGILKSLTGSLDPFLINIIRSGLAAVFFFPCFLELLFRRTRGSADKGLRVSQETYGILKISILSFICGAIQIGLTYGPYTLSFRYIKAHEVAIFTMTTPFIMSAVFLFFNAIEKKTWSTSRAIKLLAATLLATLGGLISTISEISSQDLLIGAGLVQLSNLFFAVGSVLWTRFFNDYDKPIAGHMTIFFSGAFFISCLLALAFSGPLAPPDPQQWGALLWLGVVSSGFGFFLWNKGALRVTDLVLSVFNNLKLPIAIVISILIFGEEANILQLTSGVFLIILALRIGRDLPKTK